MTTSKSDSSKRDIWMPWVVWGWGIRREFSTETEARAYLVKMQRVERWVFTVALATALFLITVYS